MPVCLSTSRRRVFRSWDRFILPLPFGRGERFGGDVNGFVNGFIGGWQVAGSARLSSGRLLDLGNVRLVGMDQDYLQSVFKLRTNSAGQVFMFPQEIIDETFKAFSVSATSATGYGNLGPPSGRYIAPADTLDCIEQIRGEGKCGLHSVVVSGPMVKQFDLSVVKRVPIAGRVSAEFRVDALNVFNNVNFIPPEGAAAERLGELLRASVLVRNRDAGGFVRNVEQLQAAWYELRLTGPWPPYRFGGLEHVAAAR